MPESEASTLKCVEPAAVEPGKNDYLVTASNKQELLFPHVDSCLAIAFVLSDGRTIGGHVGMQMGPDTELDPSGNAHAICAQMMQRVGASATVNKVVMVGDGNWLSDPFTYADTVAELKQKVGCADALFINTGEFGGGVDLSLNPRRGMVYVQQTRQTEEEKERGQPQLLFQRPYQSIAGNKSVALIPKPKK